MKSVKIRTPMVSDDHLKKVAQVWMATHHLGLHNVYAIIFTCERCGGAEAAWGSVRYH
jgi:hypothetical protein